MYGVLDFVTYRYGLFGCFSLLGGSLEGLVDVFPGQSRVAIEGVAAATAGAAVFILVADSRGGGASGKHSVGLVGMFVE